MRRFFRLALPVLVMGLVGCAKEASEIACSSPDVKAVLEQLVWEGVEATVARELAQDRVADVAGAAKAHITLTFEDVATIPAERGGRPSCAATVVGTDANNINADSNWLQRAMRRDGGIKVSGKRLLGDVEYVIHPADDGKSFRVVAHGIDSYALGLAGLGVSFRTSELQAQWESEQKAKSATPLPTTPQGQTDQPAPPWAEAAAELQTADEDLNRVYRDAMARLSEPAKTSLRDQQREWIKVRDAECSEEKIAGQMQGAGGTAVTVEIVSCKARLTEKRVGELRALKG